MTCRRKKLRRLRKRKIPVWIEAKNGSGRYGSLFIFNFGSVYSDYAPYINHLEELASGIMIKECAESFRELIRKMRSRCDDKYAHDTVMLSTFLYADEMAELATHMSYLLQDVVLEKTKE